MPKKAPFREDDLRFKRTEKEPKPKLLAVVFMAMDQSGSMSEERIIIARAVCQYFVRWIRSKREYKDVEIVFIKQEGESAVVTEEQFFTRVDRGGTRFSTAYELMNDLITKKYDPDKYNVYVIHFTDGENESGDNGPAEEEVKELLPRVNLFGYIQFEESPGGQGMRDIFTRMKKNHANLKVLVAGRTSEIKPALEELLDEN